MKLRLFGFSEELDFNEDNPGFVIISKKSYFSKLVYDINQTIIFSEGTDQIILLDDKDNLVKFESKVQLVIDPLNCDLNSIKIRNRLYQLLEQEMNLDYKLKNSFQESLQSTSALLYPLFTNFELDLNYHTPQTLTHFLKFISLSIDGDLFYSSTNNIVAYLEVISKLFNDVTLVLVNFTSFYSEEDFQSIVSFVISIKSKVIFIDSTLHTQYLDKCWLIEEDFHDIILLRKHLSK